MVLRDEAYARSEAFFVLTRSAHFQRTSFNILWQVQWQMAKWQIAKWQRANGKVLVANGKRQMARQAFAMRMAVSNGTHGAGASTPSKWKMANCTWQIANGKSTPGLHLNGRQETGFPYKDHNKHEWENMDRRDAPPQSLSHFQKTLESTLRFLGVADEDINQITRKPKETGMLSHPGFSGCSAPQRSQLRLLE